MANLFGGAEEETGHIYGSALNPSSLHLAGNKEEKELAQPCVKMEVKTNNRNALTGGAVILKEEVEDAKKKAKE